MKISKLSILAAALGVLGASTNALADAVLTVVPPSGPIFAGQTFTVAIDVTGPTVIHNGTQFPSDVSDLASFQFDLAYNCSVPAANPTGCTPGAALLRALSVTEGPFLPNGGLNTTLFEPGTINNATGEISLIGDAGFDGVTGSGTLVDVTFQALTQGTTSIAILANSDLQLSDSSFDPIVVADSVTTSPTLQTFPTNQFLSASVSIAPEPPSAQLILLGGVALVLAGMMRSSPGLWLRAARGRD
jgi:hypothetical protein